MPDIDLDFPRDIREVLIPRVHEVYGADRSALVAAFPTYRPRGVVRDLGKALGLPPEEIEKVAKTIGFHESAGEIERDVDRRDRPRARRRAALEGAALALPRRDGPAPPRLPALRRDGDLDRAADRRLPDRAGGDGGAPDRPVGQGLLRRRRLAEDRPAGAGDALRGRALRRRSRAHAGGGARPLADRARRRADLRIDPRRRDHRRLPDREPGADADAAAHPAAQHRRPHRAGGAGAAGPDPGRRRPPLYREAQARCARTREYEIPYEHESLQRGAGGDAGHDRLPGAGARGGDRRSPASPRRGRVAAAGDEPQALPGGDRRSTTSASSPAPRAKHGAAPELAERIWEKIQGFSGFGFPKAHSAAFGLLAYQSAWLRVHRGPGVPLRAAERAADGLLPARLARPRGPAPRHPHRPARRQPQPRPLPRRIPARPRPWSRSCAAGWGCGSGSDT